MFTADLSIPLLHNLWDNWRATTWGPYGFKDAFSPSRSWVGADYLGIDQGPIVLMFENYIRGGAVWNRIRANADIQTGLTRAGFLPGTTGVDPGGVAMGVFLSPVAPNPVRMAGTVHFRLPRAGRVQLAVYDVRGRRVASLVDKDLGAGEQSILLSGNDLAPGVYHLKLTTVDGVATTRFVRVR